MATQLWGTIEFNRQRNHWSVRGQWQGERLRFSSYYSQLGKQMCRTEAEALQLQLIISTEIENGSFNPARYKSAKPLSLSKFATKWLEGEKAELSAATHADYKNSLENHIYPVLGNAFIPDIGHSDLKDLLGKINRAPKGKKNVMDCLKRVLKFAIKEGIILQLPPWPEFKGVNKVVAPPIKHITIEDQFAILSKIPLKHRPVFAFMMATGCRPAEARALRKIDVTDTEIIFAVAFGRGEELKSVKQVKAEPFPRTAEIDEILKNLPKNLTPWVFPNPTTGEPYSKNINKIWNKACDDAGVARIRLNAATRHSFACQLLNSGVDRGVVSRLLRHSDPRMVERYAKYFMSPLKIAIDNVRRLPGAAERKKAEK
jgi:integrase